jgi:hypothetical protein
MALAASLFTQVNADWSAITEISVIMLFGFGFGLGMPALTDSIMASVPVEDAGIGSAVNDVSRELGSALGVAALGSFISSIYKGNVDDQLVGQVDESVVEVAKEGIGVLAAASPNLGEAGPIAFAGASQAFVDAMNSGFWLSAAVLAAGAVVAVWLLPERLREEQVIRVDAAAGQVPGPVGDPVLTAVVPSPGADVDPHDLVLVED